MAEKYREAPNLWRCPACGSVVDYHLGEPSNGQTYCDKTGKRVQMIRELQKEKKDV